MWYNWQKCMMFYKSWRKNIISQPTEMKVMLRWSFFWLTILKIVNILVSHSKKKENNFRSNLTDMHNCFYVELDLNLSFTSYHTISYKLKWFNYKYACAFTTIDIAKCHRFKDLSKIVNFIRFEISAKARRWQTMGKVSFSLMAWIFL